MTKDENIKTIRFPVKTDEKLQTIANKNGLTKLDLFIYMVDYFYKSKKDPRDLNDELLKNAINRKTDNIVAFIKTQEQELLIPMKKDSERIITVQGKIVDFFNHHILKYNDAQKAAYAEQTKNINQIAKYLSGLDTAQYDKKTLKSRFSEILEHYIQNREQMGMLTKQVEKDELIRYVRNMLRNL
ncbi:hypothetical protein SAMN05421821_10689 [Mucilaginibacter lappiensis]|uniref:Uncharacterized protein n=1 Tax=Mucilaginibacter lappiensis TaxID=354630 RepID=A0ABR6PKI3_9SPHI|nr:BfmA/BtgA family mobilization protein [Mucilaginibacter lappiensis]MBB6110282.1 hypothetical protein [Mucilaginibacter lappiensis]SIR29038.1 hypothetical protein SAMN05421821_10689 [Mucilaginibacter lappiensis]